MDTFADRLRDEVNLDALREDLLISVQQTMAPAHLSLWLRSRNRNVSGTRAAQNDGDEGNAADGPRALFRSCVEDTLRTMNQAG